MLPCIHSTHERLLPSRARILHHGAKMPGKCILLAFATKFSYIESHHKSHHYQERTIRRVIASLSEHPNPFLRFKWEQLYTVISRIMHNKHMRLLLRMNDRRTLNYISKLEKDKATIQYFKGYSRISSDEIVYWDEELAAKAADFI